MTEQPVKAANDHRCWELGREFDKWVHVTTSKESSRNDGATHDNPPNDVYEFDPYHFT